MSAPKKRYFDGKKPAFSALKYLNFFLAETYQRIQNELLFLPAKKPCAKAEQNFIPLSSRRKARNIEQLCREVVIFSPDLNFVTDKSIGIFQNIEP